LKLRLDKLLVERGISPTRERAKALILSGVVIVSENRIDKAGTLVPRNAKIRIKGADNPYVSRGGLKLKKALSKFGIDVAGFVALDVGASTGGFADCLLQESAKKVYAVDVGYGQLAWKLRNDERVIAFEKTNIRYFSGSGINDEVDIATIDTSFISLKLVIPAVLNLIKKDAIVLALIKPQFEVGRKEVGEKGVVKDPDLHRRVVDDISGFCRGLGLKVMGTCESTISGPAGNKEFFIYVKNRFKV
jgi:23S rRNA (cytidine1920-2'-O)/16S rRNA (cytidine1409-2'-O)-methyltransferase